MKLSKSNQVRLMLLFTILLTISCKADDKIAAQIVRVCYIPFSASTYAAVDRKSFNKKCTDLGEMKVSEEPLKELFDQLLHAALIKSFDDSVVRLSIRMPDGSLVYVNQDGEVTHRSDAVRIPASYMRKLDKKLYELQQDIFKKIEYK